MTEFSARKLGEVLAFAQVGNDTAERGKAALETVFGAEGLAAYVTSNNEHIADLTKMAQDAGMGEVTLAKAEATGTKLKQMRDLYVGDQWDNAVELMEWSGFFVGAAIVHWSLVNGAGRGMDSTELRALAHQAIGFHRGVFEVVTEKLLEYGQTRESSGK